RAHLIAAAARQEKVDRRLADEPDGALLATEHLGLGDDFAAAEDRRPFEGAEPPVEQLARFLGALLVGFGAVDDDDQALPVAHRRAGEAISGFLRMARLEAVRTDIHAEQRVA